MRSDFYKTARIIRRIRTQKRLERKVQAAASAHADCILFEPLKGANDLALKNTGMSRFLAVSRSSVASGVHTLKFT